MLLVHCCVLSDLGALVLAVWAWYSHLGEKETMSKKEEAIDLEFVGHRSPVRARTRTRSNNYEESISELNLRNTHSDGELEGERERVVILSEVELQRGEDEDEDSGISEPACEDRLLAFPEEMAGRGTGGKKERLQDIFVQVFFPFMIAGFGMMAAGLLLDEVQHWDVYLTINEIFILVPALLGLKGNLEMTLASRLSTAANIGQLDTWPSRWRLTWGNLSLIQGQALVVASLATLMSIILGGDLSFSHMLLLGASAMGAAAIASAVLGAIMIAVVLVSHTVRINPDNVATPIAASLGDLVTLGLLSVIAKGLFDISEPKHVVSKVLESNGSAEVASDATGEPYGTVTVSILLLLLFLSLIPVWFFLSFKNQATKSVLFYGWIPVISAMLISSGGGFVLSRAVKHFPGIAIYSPIINGVGGNLVAVQASRISTSLHQSGIPGTPPPIQYQGPLYTFYNGSQNSRTAILLLMIVVPGSAVFLSFIHVLNAGHTSLTPLFFIGYLICALLQVLILLLVADWFVHCIWRWGLDPDNIAIPFLTALGDLLGTGLLYVGFRVMWLLGDRDEDVGD